MTHRLFSRNSASSRAIPIQKMIDRVKNDPVFPVWWGKNQPGMQADESLSPEEIVIAKKRWLLARDTAITNAEALLNSGLHKQIVNRLLEPWMWITVICTATEYGNFFHLRTDKQAQPEIKKIADMMCEQYYSHKPTDLNYGDWHLPLIQPEERFRNNPGEGLPMEELRKVSVARCARVSYLTHDGRRDVSEDFKLFERLRTSGHWSPFEHVAMALSNLIPSGNFIGWKQYRKDFGDEHHQYFDRQGTV